MYKLLHTGCGGRNLQIRREGDKVRGGDAEGLQGKSRHKDHRGVDLICDALPFGLLRYTKPQDAV